jgi:hypothetical protein
MAYYALLNNANKVQKVIIGVDEDDTENLPSEFASWEEFYANQQNYPKCKRTSYNTHGNKHLKGGTPFRANFAGTNSIYDEENDVFYEESPYLYWKLDTKEYIWKPPIPFPNDANGLLDQSKPLKYYVWSDDLYAIDNTKGWLLLATYTYNAETDSWDKD